MKTPSRLAELAARLRLSGASRVGARPRVVGAPFVRNRGRLEIGDDFVLWSSPIPSHVDVARGAHVVIGHDVVIGSGAGIACASEIRVGDGVRIGRRVLLMDSDYHAAGAMKDADEPAPIVIEPGARLDDRVIVLKGARVGAGAHVTEGSVVSGVVQPNARVSGVPARVRADGEIVSGDLEERVAAIVAATFELPRVDASDGPSTIARWDSLGALHLALALEDSLGVRLDDDALASATSVAALVDLARSAVQRS